MKNFLVLVSVSLAICATAQNQSHAPRTSSESQKFTLAWWNQADEETRMGVLNGISDCMTWDAKKSEFGEPPEQLMGRIEKFYHSHNEAASMNLLDVWKNVASKPSSNKSGDNHGEIWKNADRKSVV